MDKFKVIIVEDVKLELKGTEEIFRHEIPNAEKYVPVCIKNTRKSKC